MGGNYFSTKDCIMVFRIMGASLDHPDSSHEILLIVIGNLTVIIFCIFRVKIRNYDGLIISEGTDIVFL